MFLLLASSGAALAQADGPWRGSIECRLDVEQSGYSRHEIQTWTLTGTQLPPNGDIRLYAADWTYSGDGKKNQNGVAAEWTVDVPPTSAPLGMVLRTADQRLIVRLWHSQVTSYAGLRLRNGAARQAMEWQLPWIETAPKDDLEGTLSVQTAALSVDIAQFGAPTPTAACNYRFSRTALPAVPLTTQNTPRNAPPGRAPGSLISALPDPAAPLPAGVAAPTEPQLTAAVEECKRAGPAQLQSVDVTPGRARLMWNAAAGATGYTVARNDIGALTPAPITALEFRHDYVLDSRVTYQYSVTAFYTNGCGTSAIPVKATAPTPTGAHVTTSFGNARARTGRVTLTWRSPLGPNAFVVLGPGAEQGVNVPAVARPTADAVDTLAEPTFGVDLDNVPDGQHTWHIAAAWDTPAGRSLTWDTAAEVTARVGFFRVLITGFKANAVTIDDPLDLDGRGDEIYVGAAAYIDGQVVALVHSTAHGEVTTAHPAGVKRAKAGSLTSAKGGIRDGDTFPYGGDPWVIRDAPSQTTFPFLVWEGWLGGDKQVLVNPSVWEQDGEQSAFNAWQALMLTTRPTRAAWNGSNDRESAAADVYRDTGQSKQALQITPTDQLRTQQLNQTDNERLARDEIARRKAEANAPDTSAMQLIPIPILPFSDQYIGPISKTPALALQSTSPASAVGLRFKQPDNQQPVRRGDYTIYIAIVPAQ